jgi:hypothetical protein
MNAIYQRMAEITRRLKSDRNLSPATRVNLELELDQLLQANELLCHKMACLENLSQMAYETNDMDWLHDICAQIEQLQV